MPEFVLPIENREAFDSLPEFTQGYIEAMFFTNTGSDDDGDLEDVAFDDLAPEALESIKADCDAFLAANRVTINQAAETGEDYDERAAGRDYWYTRNGHGVGFWDRGLGDLGDKLSSAAGYSSVDLYRGDDGRVYLT